MLKFDGLSKNFKKEYLLIFFLFLPLFGMFTQWGATSWWSDGARMATIESIVEHGTFQIDNSYYIETGDKFMYKGHYYSEKPPFLQIYSSIYYFIIYNLFNMTMKTHDAAVYFILTLLTIGVTSAIGLVYFYKILILLKTKKEWALFLTLVAGTGTFVLPYSTIFNNHIFSGALVVISFYYLLRVKEKFYHAIIAGLLMSLAGGIDINAFLFIPFVMIILFKEPFKTKLAFALSAVPLTVVYFLFNYQISGSFMPPSMNAKLYDFEGSAFTKENLDGLSGKTNFKDLMNYAFNILIGFRGLFSYMPVLIFSVYAFIQIFKNRAIENKRYYVYIGAISAVLILLTVFKTHDYGGNSFGARWYTLIALIAMVPVGAVYNDIKKSKIIITFFIIISCFSILIAMIGAVDAYSKTDLGMNSILNCIAMFFGGTGVIFKIMFACAAAAIFTIYFLLAVRAFGEKK